MATIIKQVWWKRIGFWMGVPLLVNSTNSLSHGPASWRSAFDLAFLVAGLFLVVYGWRQGVVVDDGGLHLRRWTRVRRRHLAWEDIADLRPTEPVKAVLHDGTEVPLFDWWGDADRVHEELVAARQVHDPASPASAADRP